MTHLRSFRVHSYLLCSELQVKHPLDLPQDVGEKQHLQHQEGVGEALPQRRGPHHTSALVINKKTKCER